MTFTYAAADAYWGLANRAHKPNATESAAFLVNAQADYTINIGNTPSELVAIENKVVMLYYLKYVLFWYQGEAEFVESGSPAQGGSSTLPSMKDVNRELAIYEDIALGNTRGALPGIETANTLTDDR